MALTCHDGLAICDWPSQSIASWIIRMVRLSQAQWDLKNKKQKKLRKNEKSEILEKCSKTLSKKKTRNFQKKLENYFMQ